MKDTIRTGLHPLWAGRGTMLALFIGLTVFAMITNQPGILQQVLVFAVACGGIVSIFDWIRLMGPRDSD